MRYFQKHIALLFIGLLAISLLPINVLHSHEESHHLASLTSKSEGPHHCDFDLHQCQGEFSKTCHHPQHISKTVAKCFTCHFHFIKGYLPSSKNEIKVSFEKRDLLIAFYFSFSGLQQINKDNKGPPFLI